MYAELFRIIKFLPVGVSMADTTKLSDDEVKTLAIVPMMVTKTVDVVTPPLASTSFQFYKSDSFSSPADAWRCIVRNEVLSEDVLVEDAIGPKVDMDAILARLWLSAVSP